jgi:hypothetical protein
MTFFSHRFCFQLLLSFDALIPCQEYNLAFGLWLAKTLNLKLRQVSHNYTLKITPIFTAGTLQI